MPVLDSERALGRLEAAVEAMHRDLERVLENQDIFREFLNLLEKRVTVTESFPSTWQRNVTAASIGAGVGMASGSAAPGIWKWLLSLVR